jgi:hypothetical protein
MLLAHLLEHLLGVKVRQLHKVQEVFGIGAVRPAAALRCRAATKEATPIVSWYYKVWHYKQDCVVWLCGRTTPSRP